MSRTAAITKFNEDLIKLFNGIEGIFCLKTIDVTTWMELYTIVFNCCTETSLVEWTLYKTATGRRKYLLTVGDRGYDRRRLCGGELYYNIETYLINYVKNLCQKTDSMSEDDLLQFYVDQWDKYQYSVKVLNSIFLYLHQIWVLGARHHGFESIYEIFPLSMLIWQEFFLKSICKRLTNICLNMIETERNTHVIINTQPIKGVIDSYMAFNFDNDMPIWFNEEPTTARALNAYKDLFEIPFLQNTEQFYRSKAKKHRNESVIEYLTKVVRYLNEEEHRVHSYLQLSSKPSFLTMIEKILTCDHANDICEEVKNVLSKGNYEDLKSLFELIKKLPIIKNQLKPIIQNHIYQIGYQSIEQISTTAINDPKLYVKTIVAIYEKFSEFIQNVFLNDFIFVDAFNQACVKFINTNVLTSAGKKSSNFLAQYCNNLLRKTTLHESEFEKNLNDIMIVFNYIEDKDTFELFYRKFLSKRLINQQGISADYEEMMISKLKQTCGSVYTSKLENILQDISLNKDLMNKYQTYCTDEQIIHPFHFSGMIFSSNSWTLSTSDDFILPEQFQSVLNHFIKFYISQHNSRKLKLLSQYSTGELGIGFTKQKYILQVSTYQMVILLLFNESTEWTVKQIENKTQLTFELLLASFHNLLKFKLLICNKETENIDENSTLRISEDFWNNKIRINLNGPLKSVEEKDTESVHRTIDEDRKMTIQAAIVRIMKARQTLKHALLMQEVIQQVNSRFRPEISVIKKCIDILIEKEYLERDSKEKDVLRYLT